MDKYDSGTINCIMVQLIHTLYAFSIDYLMNELEMPEETLPSFVNFITENLKRCIPVMEITECNEIIFRVYDGIVISESELFIDDDTPESDIKESTSEQITDIFMKYINSDEYDSLYSRLKFSGNVISLRDISEEMSNCVPAIVHYDEDIGILDLYFILLPLKLLNVFCYTASLAITTLEILNDTPADEFDISARKCQLSAMTTELYRTFRKYMHEDANNDIRIAIDHEFVRNIGIIRRCGVSMRNDYRIDYYWIF